MRDIRVVQYLGLAVVSRVETLSEAELLAEGYIEFGKPLPVVLSVQGKGFSRAYRVLLNGVEVQFRLKSDTSLLCIMPVDTIGVSLRSVDIVTDQIRNEGRASLNLGLGAAIEELTGPDKLLNQLIFLLMSNPGDSAFTQAGGGLLGLIGKNNDGGTSAHVQVAQRVLQTAEQLRNSQNGTPVPASERLRAVQIISIGGVKGDPDRKSVV
jgi:hypothetical protein